MHHKKPNIIFHGYLLLFFIVYYEFNENIIDLMQQFNRYYTTYINFVFHK
jgi:hypothetical protein